MKALPRLLSESTLDLFPAGNITQKSYHCKFWLAARKIRTWTEPVHAKICSTVTIWQSNKVKEHNLMIFIMFSAFCPGVIGSDLVHVLVMFLLSVDFCKMGESFLVNHPSGQIVTMQKRQRRCVFLCWFWRCS